MNPVPPLPNPHFTTPGSLFRNGYSLKQTISRKLIFTSTYFPLVIFPQFPQFPLSDISDNTNITTEIFYPQKMNYKQKITANIGLPAQHDKHGGYLASHVKIKSRNKSKLLTLSA